MDLLHTLLSNVPWAERELEAGRGWSAVMSGFKFQEYLEGAKEEGRGMQMNPLLAPFLFSPSQPQPSASRVEPGTVAADPRVRVVQEEHREGEKGGAGAPPFSSLPVHWPGLREGQSIP